MAAGEGSGEGGLCPGLIWSIFWFFGLLIIAWPIAFFLVFFYVLLLPFAACCAPMKDACEHLLRIVQLPLTFSRNMCDMKPCC